MSVKTVISYVLIALSTEITVNPYLILSLKCLLYRSVMTPVIMEQLEKKPYIEGLSKWKSCVLQTLLVGSFLLAAVPFGCALFAQKQVCS